MMPIRWDCLGFQVKPVLWRLVLGKKQLKPEEYAGSTFTISNLGMMQIEHFTTIINPPNSGIFGCWLPSTGPVVEMEV